MDLEALYDNQDELNKASLGEALNALRAIITNDPNVNNTVNHEDIQFLADWIKNNTSLDDISGDLSFPSLKSNGHHHGEQLEEQVFEMEAKNQSLRLLNDELTEKIQCQSQRITELERSLTSNTNLLFKTESALDDERQLRMKIENETGHYSEISRLRNRCSVLEKENEELRKICAGNRVPNYLPISPQTSRKVSGSNPGVVVHSPQSFEEAPIKESDETYVIGQDNNQHVVDAAHKEPGSGRPPRRLKKFLGKIMRSNSGGSLEEDRKTSTMEFKRGGLKKYIILNLLFNLLMNE